MAQDGAAPGAQGAGPTTDRLQALLARAAEEQLSEQRQLAAELADLRTLVAGIDAQLRREHPDDRPEQDVSSLADALAPRVADLLVERLAVTVAEQVAARVVAAQEDVERRLAAHVDDAVMALAEVLLRGRGRRRRTSSVPGEDVPGEDVPGEDVPRDGVPAEDVPGDPVEAAATDLPGPAAADEPEPADLDPDEAPERALDLGLSPVSTDGSGAGGTSVVAPHADEEGPHGPGDGEAGAPAAADDDRATVGDREPVRDEPSPDVSVRDEPAPGEHVRDEPVPEPVPVRQASGPAPLPVPPAVDGARRRPWWRPAG